MISNKDQKFFFNLILILIVLSPDSELRPQSAHLELGVYRRVPGKLILIDLDNTLSATQKSIIRIHDP